jgi:integrase
MSDLLNKIRTLRTEATGATATTGSNTKSPIYDRIEQQKVLSHIEETLDPMYALYWRLGVATGWRLSDILELEFSDIDFTTGKASIVVNKQTKSAEARAFNKVLATWKQKVKQLAAMNGDHTRYMQADMIDIKDISSLLNEEQTEQLEQDLIKAVSNAPIKRDTKQLPAKCLELIAERQAMNHHDNFIFSRSLMTSNRARNVNGRVARQGIWKGLDKVFDWFKDNVNACLKLSAYSTRKTFAYRMLKGVNGTEQNISEVMQAFGHSSIAMTMKYLGLASKADDLQTSLLEV